MSSENFLLFDLSGFLFLVGYFRYYRLFDDLRFFCRFSNFYWCSRCSWFFLFLPFLRCKSTIFTDKMSSENFLLFDLSGFLFLVGYFRYYRLLDDLRFFCRFSNFYWCSRCSWFFLFLPFLRCESTIFTDKMSSESFLLFDLSGFLFLVGYFSYFRFLDDLRFFCRFRNFYLCSRCS